MATDAAALAAIIRTGDETQIALVRNQLIRDAGHDAADQIWDEACRQVDDELGWPPPQHHSPCGTCPACRRDYALRGDGTILAHRTNGWDSPACPGSGQPPAKNGAG